MIPLVSIRVRLPRDSHRERVYRADLEHQAQGPAMPWDEAAAFAKECWASPWILRTFLPLLTTREAEWQEIYRIRQGLQVFKSRTWGGAVVNSRLAVIHLPAKGCRPTLALHELSHLLCVRLTEAAHGPEWRTTYAMLVGKFIGMEDRLRLCEAFRKQGLAECPSWADAPHDT